MDRVKNKTEGVARILVVDDEALIRQSLRDIFEYEGYAVTEAADGRQALELLVKETFVAVFCDIKMPRLDGVALLELSLIHI